MKNIRLTIEYDGSNYNGWQAQSEKQRKKGGRVKTIQGAIEGALFDILSARVRLISSSRTDSGVHALNHIANFHSPSGLTAAQIQKALNSALPKDIVIKEAKEVDRDFNAQYDAISKTYRYFIVNKDTISPFLRKYACHFRQPLDARLMKKEARFLLGRHDFSAFRSANKAGLRRGRRENNVRAVKKLTVNERDGLIEITIEANGFLYNMARNITGTLIEVGRGRLAPGSSARILKAKDRRLAGPAAPAKGLWLVWVKYSQ